MAKSNYKVILAHILSLCIIISAFLPSALLTNATAGDTLWDGTASEAPTKGAGTAEEPFLIETAANLHYVVKKATTGYYKITNDIYLNNVSNENWVSSNPNSWLKWSKFKGTLDGDGHTIYGLYCDYGDYNVAGLFPRLESGASIKNIKISKANLKNTNPSGYAGAICGQVIGYAEFKNCAVDDTVSVTAPSAGGIVAGLNGNTAGTKFTACYSRATLSGTKAAAGILANAWGGVTVTIENSYCINNFFLYTNNLITAVINNSYSPFSKTAAANPSGISGTYAVVSADNMIGADAKTNMPNLIWNTVFVTTESYPELLKFVPTTEPDTDVFWDGEVAAPTVGDGSRANPFKIKTAQELAYLSKLVADGKGSETTGKYYELANDIKINNTSADNWTSSAKQWYTATNTWPTDAYSFNGFLNGKGHTISGLYVNSSTSGSYAGLFVGIGKGATVARLNISNSDFTAPFVGGIAGREYKTDNQVIKIANVYLDETVKLTGSGAVGGLIGRGDGGISFVNCGFSGIATGAGEDKTHGIAGDIWSVGTKYEIKNTFSIYKPYRLLNTVAIELSNVYSSSEQAGVIKVTAQDASTKMTELDFYYTWEAHEGGYPTLRSIHNGDVDLDGYCNDTDISEIKKELLDCSQTAMPDVNDDGDVDIRDLVSAKSREAKVFQVR